MSGGEEKRKSRKRSQSCEGSSGGSRTSSSSSSNSPVRKKSRTSKSKKRRSKRHSSTESSSSNESSDSETNKKTHKKAKGKEEKKTHQGKKRRKKKDKRNKEKKSKLAVNQEKYGKYGILVDSDMFNKQQEFYLWLQEVKKINPEVFPRFEMKKMFETFAEDYNTVTLPHKKFYDLEKWEAKQRKKGRLKALKKAQRQQLSIENDELRHKSLHSGPTRPGMSKNDLLEMQRIMRERQQEDYKKKAGMKLDETKGVRYQTIQ
ncbi:protein FAM133B-like [Orbicella faveolata]|uniref:protein FAM133B-like n=1 Tax=Orbicella faveolata TaxID=48498 RepID=UPI0009E28F4D|nr:protein FAM133B-like [Orbicella faveolata]